MAYPRPRLTQDELDRYGGSFGSSAGGLSAEVDELVRRAESLQPGSTALLHPDDMPPAPPEPEPVRARPVTHEMSPFGFGPDGPDPVSMPAAAPAPRQSAVRAAAADTPRKPEAVPIEEYDLGEEPPSRLETFIKQLPQVAGAFATAATARGGGALRGLGLVQGYGQRVAQIGSEDDATRSAYDKRRTYYQRLAGRDRQDAEDRGMAREDRTRRIAREDAADRRRQGADTRFRQFARTQYPKFAAGMGAPTVDELTTDDKYMLEPSQAEAEARAKGDAERAKRENVQADKKDLITFRLEEKRRLGIGSGGGTGASVAGPALPGVSADQLRTDLGAQYGGWDKVPPIVKSQYAQIESMQNPRKRAEGRLKLSQQVLADTHKNTTEERLGAGADLKEIKEYERISKDLHAAEGQWGRTAKEFAGRGFDLDTYKGGDIPGKGRFESFVPTLFQGDAGQALRQRTIAHVANYARQLSGLTVTDRERATIDQMIGAGGGMSDAALVRGLIELRQIQREGSQRADSMYPNAARQFRENMQRGTGSEGMGGQPTMGVPGGAPAARVRVRYKGKDGKVIEREIDGSRLEDARKRAPDLEVVQ